RLDTLSPVQGAVRGISLSPELRSAVAVVEKSTRFFSDRLSGLYLEFSKSVLPDALAALIAGKITPEEFGQRLEAAAERIRRNPDIYKPPPRGVPHL
ncbi:MAG: hypothetical protein ABIN58_09770, partial [candidate division WOR-3 bacterium]